MARKLAGPEKSVLDGADIAFDESEYQRLRGELQASHEASKLPELPSEATRAALNDLLVRVRLQSVVNSPMVDYFDMDEGRSLEKSHLHSRLPTKAQPRSRSGKQMLQRNINT